MYTGVGYSLNAKLSSLGVSTCADLQKLSLMQLQKHCGTKTGQTLYNSCRGTYERTFRTGVERKSVSAEMNYGIRFSTVVAASLSVFSTLFCRFFIIATFLLMQYLAAVVAWWLGFVDLQSRGHGFNS